MILRLKNLRSLLARARSGNYSSFLFLWEPSALFSDILRKAKSEVTSWGGQLFFIHLPAWYRYGTAEKAGIFTSCLKNVLYMVEGWGIPIIEFPDVMDNHIDPLSLFLHRFQGHYMPQGYHMLAELISNYLDSEPE